MWQSVERYIIADLGRARNSQVHSGSARDSAEKTHHVLYFLQSRRFEDIKYDTVRGYCRGDIGGDIEGDIIIIIVYLQHYDRLTLDRKGPLKPHIGERYPR